MKKQVGLWAPWVVALGVFLGAVIYLHSLHRKAADSEPDQFFHLALGRQMAQHGIIRALPQIEDTRWKKTFPNDYFLFTALVAAGWKWGGEEGARWVGTVLVVALLLLVFGFCRRYIGWGWALVLSLSLVFNHSTLTRLLSLRPSLLAACFFVGLIWALAAKNKWATAGMAAGYVLSYHAVYFPFLVLVSAAALAYLAADADRKKAAGWGFLGFAVGIVAHPGFPASLEMVGNVFTAIFHPVLLPFSEASVEAQGWTKETLLGRMPFGILILALSVWALWREFSTQKRKRLRGRFWESEFLLLFLLSAVFTSLLFISFRAMEYAGPLLAILSAAVLSRVTKQKSEKAALAGWGVLLLFPEAAQLVLRPYQVYFDSAQLQAAIQSLPAEAEGKKIYNCDWYTGGPLLFWKPTARFVDMGDPGSIEATHPGFAQLKASVRNGKTPYALGPIRFAFQADYVLCQQSPLVEAMEFSPHFRRVFPRPEVPFADLNATDFTVYEVAKGLHPSFITRFEKSQGTVWQKMQTVSLLPEAHRSPFLNLPPAMNSRALSSQSEKCLLLRPTLDQIRQHSGARFLGVGGGPSIEITLNGRRFFKRENWSALRELDTLVPLAHPLETTDHLEVEICSDSAIPHRGVALSFWQKADLHEICAWKKNPYTETTEVYFDRARLTCLGTLAGK